MITTSLLSWYMFLISTSWSLLKLDIQCTRLLSTFLTHLIATKLHFSLLSESIMIDFAWSQVISSLYDTCEEVSIDCSIFSFSSFAISLSSLLWETESNEKKLNESSRAHFLEIWILDEILELYCTEFSATVSKKLSIWVKDLCSSDMIWRFEIEVRRSHIALKIFLTLFLKSLWAKAESTCSRKWIKKQSKADVSCLWDRLTYVIRHCSFMHQIIWNKIHHSVRNV